MKGFGFGKFSFKCFELIDFLVDLVLALECFFFDVLKKDFDFSQEIISLFFFFEFDMLDEFFKALIKIEENEIVPGLVEELQSLVLRLLEEGGNLLEFILESDVLEFGTIPIRVKVEEESEFVGTGRAVDVGVNFLENFLLKFLLLRYLWVRRLLSFFRLSLEFPLEPVQVRLDVPVVLFVVEVYASQWFWLFPYHIFSSCWRVVSFLPLVQHGISVVGGIFFIVMRC